MIKKVSWQYRKHGFNPWIGKIPWRWKWLLTPVFLSGKSMDRGAWLTTVHGVKKSRTLLSAWTTTTKNYKNLITHQSTFISILLDCKEKSVLDALLYLFFFLNQCIKLKLKENNMNKECLNDIIQNLDYISE